MIPYGRQTITESDVDSVNEVLRSDWLTQGPSIKLFEEEVAKYCGTNHALAICNATAALHLACLALDVGPGDRVWTSPNTFVASANCALYCGADIDFVDIDPRTYNMCANALAQKLESANKLGKLPKVIIPVHFAGQSCDMKSISELANKYHIKVIEDASHAIGGDFFNSKIGSSTYSDITIFSFHPVKIITTGEGGMALTNNADLYQRLSLLRSHGITRDPSLMKSASHGGWYYQQVALGYNYRMTDIQAALGRSQLTQLDKFIERRRYLADRYNKAFKDLPLITPWQHSDGQSAWHLYVIQVMESLDRQQLFRHLQANGINVNVHYIPVHTQPYYQQLGFEPDDFPNSVQYYHRAISLPLYYGLNNTNQDFVIETIRKFVI